MSDIPPPPPPAGTPPPPPPAPKRGRRTAVRAKETGDRLVRFLRAYTDGIDQRKVQRLFGREATRAFTVLVDAPRDDTGRPRDQFSRLLDDVRRFFLGLAFKLSPPRRLLFTFALLCPVLGIFDLDVTIGAYRLFVDASPFWFLTALAAMTLLLALELVDRMRVRDELEVARQLQRDLLPHEPPIVPGYRIACSSRMATEIGGDYYDLIPLDDDRLAVVVGDASGHGMGAGLLMAIANATFKTAIDLDPSPARVLEHLNRVLVRTGGSRAFMSIFYGILDLESGRLEHASAGHPFPMLRRAGGTVEDLGRGSFPLGLRADSDFPTAETHIAPGDLLVLYSDGIPEALGADDEAFGFDRLRRLVAGGGPAEHVHDRTLAAVSAFMGERSLEDDLTLAVLERLA